MKLEQLFESSFKPMRIMSITYVISDTDDRGEEVEPRQITLSRWVDLLDIPSDIHYLKFENLLEKTFGATCDIKYNDKRYYITDKKTEALIQILLVNNSGLDPDVYSKCTWAEYVQSCFRNFDEYDDFAND